MKNDIKKEWARVFKELTAAVNHVRPIATANRASGQIAWRHNDETFLINLLVYNEKVLRISSLISPWKRSMESFVRKHPWRHKQFELSFLPIESSRVCDGIVAFTEQMPDASTNRKAPKWALFDSDPFYPANAFTAATKQEKGAMR